MYPERIIIHSMGEYILAEDNTYHAKDWLEKLGLSCHYFITPGGHVIKMLDPTIKGAHAKGHNQDTLGIELLVQGEYNYYTFLKQIKEKWCTYPQFLTALELVEDLCNTFKIKEVVRHSDVDPDRKKDPGDGFDWNKFIDELNI